MTHTNKVVIPVAGLGTRFLPMTKAMPKEMLPIVDKPAIQYVVEEAAAAGLTDVLMVTGRSKTALENHFDRHSALEHLLTQKGATAALNSIMHPSTIADIHYLRQGEALGLGHAVLQARSHVGNQPFAVLLGDDLVDPNAPVLSEMLRLQEHVGGSVIALQEVPADEIHKYGCAAVTELSDLKLQSMHVDRHPLQVNFLVEKPAPGTEPSNLAIIGRYVLHPAVFEILEHLPAGRGGEIQLTDALQILSQMDPKVGGGVHAVVYRGNRYDTGDKLSYLKTVVEFASAREDLGSDFLEWLETWLANRQS
jgi:UTP--glucose-1-phosphate uridylyltransferase